MAQALVAFFAIIDPLGNIIVFHLFTRDYGRGQKILAAAVSVCAAFAMLVAFSLGGEQALEFLGISEESFKVAAGLLLLPPAYRLVMEGVPAVDRDAESSALEFALVPLATPLIAGPGALAATTSFTAADGSAVTLGAISIVLGLTFVAFVTADWIFRLLGSAVLRLMARIVGIILFAIAVDFVIDGLAASELVRG